MAHDTHHDTHGTHHDVPANFQSRTSFSSAFFFVAILAGLFIAGVNFARVMGNDDEGGHGATTEHSTEHTVPTREATSSQTMEGETGVGKPADHATENPGHVVDTTHVEGH
jgi:hypothetical protein